MKRLPPYTLLLLIVLYHTFSDADGRCEFVFVYFGENATIKCKISNPDQDGVYLYMRQPQGKVETVFYYYKAGILTLENPFMGRVTTNGKFGDFSVSLRNVRVEDHGVYWCKFNKLDKYTESDSTFLIIQPRNQTSLLIQPETETKDSCVLSVYLGVIFVQAILILFLVLILLKLYRDRGNYTIKHQSSNGVYEVMRSNTARSLHNPEYVSRQKLECTN